MAARFVLFCASALFVQAAFGQYISTGQFLPSSNYVSGNSVVENTIVLGGSTNLLGGGLSGGNLLGTGLSSANLGGLVGLGNLGVVGSGIGLTGGLTGSSGVVIGSLGGQNIVTSGPLVVTSISPIGPSGLAVASENVIEGTLLVSGSLPFLSAVAFEGALPSAGSGIATCSCGTGSVGIISEGLPLPLQNNLPRGLFY